MIRDIRVISSIVSSKTRVAPYRVPNHTFELSMSLIHVYGRSFWSKDLKLMIFSSAKKKKKMSQIDQGSNFDKGII